MKTILQFITQILDRLSSKPRIGGLHISDAALSYYTPDGSGPRTVSLRIPPGVIVEGKIPQGAQFRALLTQFREMVDSEDRTRLVPVVVTLPGSLVYTQSFNVPNVGMERLPESAALNLRMLSPIPYETAYLSWQRIRETPERFELLGAFADRERVNALQEAIEYARFHPVAIEFPGLSLTRLVTRAYRASEHPLLIFYLSSEGLNLVIVRNGELYFDYFRSWQSVQGKSREMSRAMFDEVVSQEVQKVSHFSLSRLQEAPEEVVIIAPGFEAELQQFIRDQFGFQTVTLDLAPWMADQSGAIALGASFRGEGDRAADTAVSLAPVGSAELFYQEQLLSFIGLWRVIVGSVLGLFLILFGGSAYLLVTQSKTLAQQLTIFADQDQRQKLQELVVRAEQFNALVGTITAARGTPQRFSVFLERIQSLAAANRIALGSFDLRSADFTNPIEIGGQASSLDTVTRFKQVLQNERDFFGVSLPLSQVSTREDGSVVFSISVRFDPTRTSTGTPSGR